MSRAWIGVALGCLTVSVFVYPTRRSDRDENVKRLAELRAEVAVLEQTLADERARSEHAKAAFETRLAATWQSRARACIAPASSADLKRTAAVADGGVTSDAGEQEVVAAEESAAPENVMTKAFAAESDDPSWTRSSEQAIARSLRAQLPHTTIDSVECRTRLCRVTTIQPTEAVVEELPASSFTEPAARIWNQLAYSSIVAEADGELVVVSYLTREGWSPTNQ